MQQMCGTYCGGFSAVVASCYPELSDNDDDDKIVTVSKLSSEFLIALIHIFSTFRV